MAITALAVAGAAGKVIMSALSAMVNLAILGQSIDQYQLSEQAGKYRPQLIKLAKEISSKIANNNTKLARFQNAYNNRNNELISQMFTGMGYGDRINTLIKDYNKNNEELDKITKQVGDSNRDLSNQLDDVNTKMSYLGTSHAANESAGLEETGLKKAKSWIEQNILGGISS